MPAKQALPASHQRSKALFWAWSCQEWAAAWKQGKQAKQQNAGSGSEAPEMKAWTEGPKSPLLIAEEPLWDLNRSVSIFCFQIFKSQETTWEPDKDTLSSGKGCDFYWSISTLTYTEHRQNTQWRTQRWDNAVCHPVPKANAAPRRSRFERLRNGQVNLEVIHHFGDALRLLLPLEIPAEPPFSSHWLPATAHKWNHHR